MIVVVDASVAIKWFLAGKSDEDHANLAELRYLLDPAEVMGADYPSETFRVLKEGEIHAYGEYRTRRLVLEAWDELNMTIPMEMAKC